MRNLKFDVIKTYLSNADRVHGAFYAFLGSLHCTRKSYTPPCRGKFALSESTVSKIGKKIIFPLYYLILFQSLIFDIVKIS